MSKADELIEDELFDEGPTEAVEDATPDPEPTEAELTLEQIRDANRLVVKRQAEYDAKHLQAKAAKEALAESQDALSRLITSLTEEMPLFDQPKPSPNGEAAGEPDDDWRAMPLNTLRGYGLPLTAARTLETNGGLATLGQLADWTAGGKQLTDIPGIGAAKAEAIEAASMAFFEARNRAGVEQADVESGEPDSD